MGQGLDALALAVEEQPLNVDTGPARGFGLGEIGCETGRVLAQAFQNRRVEIGGERLHDPLEG